MTRIKRRRGAASHDLLEVVAIVSLFVGGAFLGSGFWNRRKVGTGPKEKCAFEEVTINLRCAGYWPKKPNEGEFLAFASSLPFAPSKPILRKVKAGEPRSTTFEVVTGSSLAAFRDLSGGSLVFARMVTDPNGGDDLVYPIGASTTKGFQKTFYFVFDSVRIAFIENATKPLARPDSVRLGWYSLWGVDGSGTPTRLMVGKLSWCTHMHYVAPREDKAAFWGCRDAALMTQSEKRILEDKRLLDAENAALRDSLSNGSLANVLRTADKSKGANAAAAKALIASVERLLGIPRTESLMRIARDEESDAGWITCGTGCCSLGLL